MPEPRGDTHLSGIVINAAIEVHSQLGPGLLESAYRTCLLHELRLRNLRFEVEVPLPVWYKDVRLDVAYRMDTVVERSLVLEIKAVDKFHPVHQEQLLSYLRLSGCKLGLLLNFHAPMMRDGIKRMVNG